MKTLGFAHNLLFFLAVALPAWANEPAPKFVALEPTSSAPAAASLAPELTALRDKLHRALTTYYHRVQHADRRSPWAVMHWIVAYGTDAQLRVGEPATDMTAIGYLLFNGRCRGQNILYVDGQGRLGVHSGSGVQGHEGQLLGYLAQSRLQPDYPLHVQGRQFSMADLIEHEKRTCRPQTELTFKLMGLGHYLPSDAQWRSDDNQQWSIPRLIREELEQPVRGAACGGTHRLMGLSVAVRRRVERGGALDGEFWRADKFIRDYHQYTLGLQNADGSFSTEWFWRKADSADDARKLDTTGHIFEWLAYSYPVDQLLDPRLQRAANRLADLLLASPQRDWEIGPLGHALHGLALYEERTFKSWKPLVPPPAAVADKN